MPTKPPRACSALADAPPDLLHVGTNIVQSVLMSCSTFSPRFRRAIPGAVTESGRSLAA